MKDRVDSNDHFISFTNLDNQCREDWCVETAISAVDG
jgi:hypothetical protein